MFFFLGSFFALPSSFSAVFNVSVERNMLRDGVIPCVLLVPPYIFAPRQKIYLSSYPSYEKHQTQDSEDNHQRCILRRRTYASPDGASEEVQDHL